jgi:hypothetical protein
MLTDVAGKNNLLTKLIIGMTHGGVTPITTTLNLTNLLANSLNQIDARGCGFTKLNFGNHKNYGPKLFTNNNDDNAKTNGL